MSDLRWQDIIDMSISVDAIMRPWAAFIGAVELRQSPYCSEEAVYKLNAAAAGFPDLGLSILMHPDTVPKMVAAAKQQTGREMSDKELAAYVCWLIDQQPRKATSD